MITIIIRASATFHRLKLLLKEDLHQLCILQRHPAHGIQDAIAIVIACLQMLHDAMILSKVVLLGGQLAWEQMQLLWARSNSLHGVLLRGVLPLSCDVTKGCSKVCM